MFETEDLVFFPLNFIKTNTMKKTIFALALLVGAVSISSCGGSSDKTQPTDTIQTIDTIDDEADDTSDVYYITDDLMVEENVEDMPPSDKNSLK